MFVRLDNATYVAPPNDAAAVALLALRRNSRLKTLHRVLVVVPGGLFLIVGTAVAYLVIGTAESWRVALGGIAVAILCVIGTLTMGKAAIAIFQQSQLNQFRQFVHKKRILKLPELCSRILYELLWQKGCTNYLTHYRPDPYDFGDLHKIVEEMESGSGSPTYASERLMPALARIVEKIHQAQQNQESADTQAAQIHSELPRPDGSSRE